MNSAMILYMSSKDIVKEDLISGEYRMTAHAIERMNERKITKADISECAATGTFKMFDGKFEVVGFDMFGEKMKIICAYKNGVLIITVY